MIKESRLPSKVVETRMGKSHEIKRNVLPSYEVSRKVHYDENVKVHQNVLSERETRPSVNMR